MTQAIDLALTQLTVQEKTGANDGIPAERYMRGDQLAWCAGFVLWCNEQSDDPDVTVDDKTYYRLRSVAAMIEHFRGFGAFFAATDKSFKPTRNDIIFFGKTVSDVGVRGSHVGLVEKVDDVLVHTVEGNTSNRVARRRYRRGDAMIVGYGRVVAAMSEKPVVVVEAPKPKPVVAATKSKSSPIVDGDTKSST